MKKKALSVILSFALIFSLFASFTVISSSAAQSYDIATFPRVVEATAATIADFYKNSSVKSLLSTENAKIEKVDYQGSPATSYIIAFTLTDIVGKAPSAIESVDLDTVLQSITSFTNRSYLGVTALATGANLQYSTKTSFDKETMQAKTVISAANVFVSIIMRETAEQTQYVVDNFVKPFLASLPSDMTTVQKIYRINQYILNGQFSYDTTYYNRKSVYQMVYVDKKGVCEEYAGLSMLFFNELLLENIIALGMAGGTAHAWNLVKIDGQWYNSDILWDGPINDSGAHVQVTTKYLLKKTASISDHAFYTTYSDVSVLANKDIDESLFVYTSKQQNPNVPAAPLLQSKTASSITVSAQSGVEFSLDKANWQESGSFTGLKPNTEYKIYARYSETDKVYASQASEPLAVRTSAPVVLSGGDLDGDSAVSIADAVISFSALAGKQTLSSTQLTQADINKSGDVDLQDTMIIFMYVAGKIDKF